jgi:hypothetical protein
VVVVLAFFLVGITAALISNRTTTGSVFAVTSAARSLAFPACMAVAMVALYSSNARVIGHRVSPALGFLLLAIVGGNLSSWLNTNSIQFDARSFLQDEFLLLGFPIFYLVGVALAASSPAYLRFGTWVIAIVGSVSVIFQVGFGNLVGVEVPLAAALAIWGFLKKQRTLGVLALIATLALAVNPGERIDPSQENPSTAALASWVLCLGWFAIVAVVRPRLSRANFRRLLVLLIMTGLLGVLASDQVGLVLGFGSSSDVTVTQRIYEAGRVSEVLDQSPGGAIWGAGFGSTMDLSSSPDASTLLSSGRDLFRVHAVHLLFSYVRWKMGLLGVLWIMAWLIELCVLCYRLALSSRTRAEVLAAALLCFPLSAFALGLPAATNLLINPLAPLATGYAWSVLRQRGPRPGWRRRAVVVARCTQMMTRLSQHGTDY